MIIRVDPNDVMFAGAGILWGMVTLFRGMQAWHRRLMTIGLMMTIICLGYLAMAFADTPAAPVASKQTYLEELQAK